jgi:hypothetical protein
MTIATAPSYVLSKRETPMRDMQICVPCPKCGAYAMRMLSILEQSERVFCPCGGVTDLTKPYWRKTLREARKSADEFDFKSH